MMLRDQQEAQPLAMTKAVGFAAGRDLGEGLGHAMQAKGVKLVEGSDD